MENREVASLLIETAFGGSMINTMDSFLAADKFSVAVHKAKEIVSLNDSHKARPQPEIGARITARTDRLLGFLLSQFRDDINVAQVQEVIERPKGSTSALNTDDIIEMAESIVPLAIIRELFFTHRIHIEPAKLNNWPPFAFRYQSVL